MFPNVGIIEIIFPEIVGQWTGSYKGPPQMSITFSPKCIHNMCFSADRQSQVMKSTERHFFSEYRTYVSLYYNAYLKKQRKKKPHKA